MTKDYYKILGVEKGATEDDIKKAYRKLAHQFHPDKPSGNEQKFKEINEAYQILSNKEKKAQYDRFGQVFEGGSGSGVQGQNPFAGFGFDGSGFRWSGGGEEMGDFGDIFEGIFEQFGMGGKRRKTYKSGSDIEAQIQLSLEEAFVGVKRKLEYKTYLSCVVCGGVGFDKKAGLENCATCQGKGEVREQRQTFFGNFSQVVMCPKCSGQGQIPNKVCGVCGGAGRKLERKSVDIEIAPGVEDGQIITIKGAGEAGERGSGGGDLYVVVRVKPHNFFERKKVDFYITEEIKITDALLSKKIPIKDINGEIYHITIPTGFNLKDKLKISGKGMTRFGSVAQRGDLYVSFNLKILKSLSTKAKKLLEELDGEI